MLRLYQQRLQVIVDELQPDIISTAANVKFACCTIVRLRTTAKRVVESHNGMDFSTMPATPIGTLIESLQSKWQMKTLCRIIRKFDMLVALTRRDAEAWKSVARGVVVIPNPVTAFPLVSRPMGVLNRRIIAAGRLCHQKGFSRLIKAFSSVAGQCEGWHLDIFGNGEEEQALKDLIKNCDMEYVITIHPFSSDIYKEYMSSDFFVLNSYYEAFGLVLIEAMSCSLPCISFDCRYGPREIVHDSENGFLVPEGNVTELGEKIRWMCQHAECIPAMGMAARATAQRYRKEEIMPQWIDLFNSLLQD